MDSLRKYLAQVRVPTASEAIYKDECMYSYDNPETPTGLYVSLATFLGFGENYVDTYSRKSGDMVFLHIHRIKTLKKDAADADTVKEPEEGPERKITRLAIGIEGGYNEADMKKYDYTNTYSIVVMPNKDTKLPYPNEELPLIVTEAVEALLSHDSAIAKLEKQVLSGTWDGEVRQVSKYAADLVQLDNGKKIPPSGWKCEKCDLTANLWLNLTDGAILCGRKFFDGSGGNDHAVEHYREKQYPLAVKLGTIAADGKSDVFSYPEDDMVIDPQLEKHLAHFGINMAAMKKSEKSMIELELEINQRIGEWSLLTESDSELKPLAGPGYTGMRNLGNSCYINSVMQVLFTIPDFQKRFVGDGATKYFNEFPVDPANDFNIQMAKLGNGLWSGKYSSIADNSLDSEMTGIAPTMFKNVIGKNHPDFSSKQQQDAYDFYLHLVNMLERHSRNQFNPVEALTFGIEERMECMTSKTVKYTRRNELCLPLEIPLERAINLNEVKEYMNRQAAAASTSVPREVVGAGVGGEDVVRHIVPLQACLDKFFGDEIIEQFYSSAIDAKTTAVKRSRLASMPDFLMMHLRKFTLGDDWVPRKLDVSVQMPDELDISKWRARGLQTDELPMPDVAASVGDAAAGNLGQFVYDAAVISELLQMGFPQESCKRAVYHTQNSGLEAASNWLMAHIGDADIADPFEAPANSGVGGPAGGRGFVPNPESLAMLMSMGFDEHQSTKALLATDGNVERATDWIFSHVEEMDTDEMVATAAALAASIECQAGSDGAREFGASAGFSGVGGGGGVAAPIATGTDATNHRDGVGKYKLVAFISHMGTSAQVGHYVCHILKDGQWVIYNDSKVAVSQNPPKDLGYLYLYKRIE